MESAVEFATVSRIHIALGVRDLAASVAFYRTLFGQEPTKVRPGYTKFEVAEPPLNIALNEVTGNTEPSHPVSHFGIQVKSTCAVDAYAQRLTAAGLSILPEEHVTCCYAVQNKFWATDPDGNRWEVYVLLDDNGAQHGLVSSSCCPDTFDIAFPAPACDRSASGLFNVVEKPAATSANPGGGCCGGQMPRAGS